MVFNVGRDQVGITWLMRDQEVSLPSVPMTCLLRHGRQLPGKKRFLAASPQREAGLRACTFEVHSAGHLTIVIFVPKYQLIFTVV